MSKLPKEVQNEIRDTNKRNADLLAHEIKAKIGAGDPPQARLVESAIDGKRDRNIRVDAGGAKRVGRPYKSSKSNGRSYRAPAGALIYGAEYGSSGKPQDRRGRTMGARFVRPHNKDGYFIGPALKNFTPKLLRIWSDTIQAEIKKRGLQ
ncbi:MAG: hypothetical protein ACR2IJ_07650 [Fluviibacter sp.]